MEVICSLPLDPRRALIKELCEDLPLRSQSAMVNLIRSLMPEYGIQLVFTESFGFVTYVLRSNWEHVKKTGQHYWEQTYGN